MRKIQVDRLNRLILILRSVPQEKFGILSWDCETTACAGGWAMRDSIFRKQGLVPQIYALEQTYALYTFFGLTKEEGRRIFQPGSYKKPRSVTPADVIARIREIVNGRRAIMDSTNA